MKPLYQIIILTIFVTLFVKLMQFMNFDKDELDRISCASPFAILKTQDYISIIIQPFLVRNIPDLLALFFILVSIYIKEKARLGPFVSLLSPASSSSDLFEDPTASPPPDSPTESIFDAFPSIVRRQVNSFGISGLVVAIYFLNLFFRCLLGFIFFNGTGFAFPKWFFHSSYYDCSTGIHPTYLPYVLISGYFKIMNRELLVDSCTVNPRELKEWYLKIWYDTRQQVLFALLAFIFPSSLIWTMASSLLTALTICFFGSSHKILTSRFSSIRKWSALLYSTAFLISLITTSSLFFVFIKLLSQSMIRTDSIDLSIINGWFASSASTISVVIVTAPRKLNADFLIQTIDSFNDNYPRHVNDTLHGRIRLLVYTEFLPSEHAVFEDALHRYEDFVEFYRRGKKISPNLIADDNSGVTTKSQRLHFGNALSTALENDSAFILLMEDDFPLCTGSWDTFLSIFYHSYKNYRIPSEGPCGIFIGTGGSGILIRRDVAAICKDLLLSNLYRQQPTDLIIQDCLRGRLPQCSRCLASNSRLVASPKLLMRHLGYDTSTYAGRKYTADQYQCGWRHPFNGEPDVHVIETTG